MSELVFVSNPFASPGDELEHFGVKGMKWGVRKERSPEQQIASINKKINRMDMNDVVDGLGLIGWASQKKAKRPLNKDPNFFKKMTPEQKLKWEKASKRKVQRTIIARGAVTAGVILGGTTLLANKMGSSPQAKAGAQVSALLLSGRALSDSAMELYQIRQGSRFKELDRKRYALGYQPDGPKKRRSKNV